MFRRKCLVLAIAVTTATFVVIILFSDYPKKEQPDIFHEGKHESDADITRLKEYSVYKDKYDIEISTVAKINKSSTINVHKTFVRSEHAKFETSKQLHVPSANILKINKSKNHISNKTISNLRKRASASNDKTTANNSNDELTDSTEERDCGISIQSMDIKLEWMKIREEKRVNDEDRLMIRKQRKLLEQQQMELEQEKIKLAEEMRRFKAYRQRLDEIHKKSRDINEKQAAPPPARRIGDLWLGLDPHKVESKFPGLQLDGDYLLRPFVDPEDPRAMGMFGNPHSQEDMTEAQAEERFYQLVSSEHVHCSDVTRMGNTGDGGWDVCVAEPYKPHLGCLIYSFGINNDFTFDDAMSETFNCDVKSFDPSMNVDDHMHSDNVFFYNLGLGSKDNVTEKEWTIMTLSSILTKLGHTDTTIDYLKFDIEFSEWESLQNMLLDKSLANVKQLAFEIHTAEVAHVNRQSNKLDYIKWYSALLGLEHQGFRRFHYHFNPYGRFTSLRTGRDRSCCYELYYINLKFVDVER